MYDPLYGERAQPWWRNKKILIGIAVGLVLLIVSIVIIVESFKSPKSATSDTFPSLVELMNSTNIKAHLQSLQDIAHKHGGNRAALGGYNASVAYVISRIKAETNFSVTTQDFTFLYFDEITPPMMMQTSPFPANYTEYEDYRPLNNVCSGNITAQVKYAGVGCQASDYAGVKPGEIAFVLRNNLKECSVYQKVHAAAAAGASAILIGTDESYGLFGRGLNNTSPIPSFSVSFELGSNLALLLPSNTIIMHVFTNTVSGIVTTTNILVDTPMGDPTQTIIVGSHLDSVPAGPGINDNGSGASINLELAIQLMKSNTSVKNRIRFAWWAAEEFGHLGSEAYVAHIQQTKEIQNISLNLNYDMEGSPNYITMLYNGTTAPSPARKGTEAINNIYHKYCDESNIPYEIIELGGGSDYNSFMQVGIPVGGMSSGTDDIKDAAGRNKYGGLANTPCDPCYHMACDTIENVSMESVMLTADIAAYVLQTLAGADLKALL